MGRTHTKADFGRAEFQVSGGCKKGWRVRARALIISALLTVLVAPALTPVPAAGATAGASTGATAGTSAGSRAVPSPTGEVKPVSVVILVDESGSLTEDDVRRERQAAELLAVGEFAKRSQVEVVGFGSKNDPRHEAVDVVCRLTSLETRQNRQALQNCIGELHRRTPEEGNDTDHSAALSRALTTLRGVTDPEQAKIVFLLTDGVLDVRNSPHLGTTPEARQTAARRDIEGHLREAERLGVQIWPLGFGDADLAQLNGFAVGRPCNLLEVSRPRARVIQDRRQLFQAMVEAYSAARCAGHDVGDPQILAGGRTVDYELRISPIATDGSITVVKRDPRFQVSYFDPKGREVPKNGEFDGSTFEVSGEDTGVEGLRIRDPLPGTWRVQVTAPAGAARQEVLAAVLWQGAVHASITLDDPAPLAGRPVTVRSRLQTRQGAVVAPEELEGLRFQSRLEGDGLTPVTADLRDDGAGPDREAGDGEYAGRIVIPEGAPATVRFVGVVSGEGVQGDEIPYEVRLGRPGALLRTVVDIPRQTVAPGGTARGVVHGTNDTGRGVNAVLSIEGLREGDRVTVRDPAVPLPVGQSSSEIVLDFAPGTALGPVPAQLVLRDRDDPAVELGRGFIKVEVAAPPPWWMRYAWQLAAAAAALLALLIVLAVLVRALRRERDVQDLTLVLYRGDRETHRWRAPAGRASHFDFTVRDAAGDHPRVDRPAAGDPVYRVRRDRAGVEIRTPEGERLRPRGGRPEPIGHGLGIAVLDDRAAPQTPPYPPSYPSYPSYPSASSPFAHPSPDRSGPAADRPLDDLL